MSSRILWDLVEGSKGLFVPRSFSNPFSNHIYNRWFVRYKTWEKLAYFAVVTILNELWNKQVTEINLFTFSTLPIWGPFTVKVSFTKEDCAFSYYSRYYEDSGRNAPGYIIFWDHLLLISFENCQIAPLCASSSSSVSSPFFLTVIGWIITSSGQKILHT